MGFGDLLLEPPWGSICDGTRINTLVTMVVHDPTGRKHLAKTNPGLKFVLLSGPLPVFPMFSLIDVLTTQSEGRTTIDVSTGHALAHQVPDSTTFSRSIEVCSGIGCMAQGLEACGISTAASNELRAPFCQLMTMQGQRGVVQGDLGDPSTLVELHEKYPHPAWLTSGFSCQPWSQLGDRKGSQDKRSQSLVHTLHACFYLQAHTLILECVEGAGNDHEVSKLLKEFCALTEVTGKFTVIWL